MAPLVLCVVVSTVDFVCVWGGGGVKGSSYFGTWVTLVYSYVNCVPVMLLLIR